MTEDARLEKLLAQICETVESRSDDLDERTKLFTVIAEKCTKQAIICQSLIHLYGFKTASEAQAAREAADVECALTRIV